jgi:hypothetical protein
MLHRRSLGLAASLVAMLGLALALPAAGQAKAAMRAQGRVVSVDVTVDRFSVNRAGKPVAHATAVTRVVKRNGRIATAGDRVTLAVKTAATGCKVLDLSLQKLKLTLLGLTVDTSAVNVHITGNQTGSLGKLFCQLANGLKLSNVTKTLRAVKAMNRSVRARPMHVLSFRSPMATKSQAAPGAASCRVLDLTLGPLNLDLLGLNVDLYGLKPTDPVVVTITADPAGGALGKLFCALAANAGS